MPELKVKISCSQLERFILCVWAEGALRYRDLPWRNTVDPYAVLVSEVMLQQTQVSRVLKHWERFMALFPTLDALASADTSLVLEQWQGLGYNRRALSLKRTAETCASTFGGTLPNTVEGLLALPGIGEATAAGVLAFAHNLPSIYLETNVRTVFIHELFTDAESVSDKELKPLVEQTCPQDRARDWYYALLDYGAYLKQTTINPSRKSAHYATQSSFAGSRRQKRAELLRCVLAEPGIDIEVLFDALETSERAGGRPPADREEFESILFDLVKEGFFRKEGSTLFS